MRIVEFVNSLDIGGTERQVVNLTRGLRAQGFPVELACFLAQGELAGEVERLRVPLHEYPINSLRRPSAAKSLLAIARYLRRNRIDVLHASGFYPNVLAVMAAALAGTPVIIAAVRDMGHMWTPWQRRVQRAIGFLADGVITNAHAVAARLRDEGWNTSRIHVIHNGIDHRPPPPSTPDLRRQLGIPPRAPLVGVVSRLTRVKGIEDFIDAAGVVASHHPEARFVIMGGPIPDALYPDADVYDRELRRRAASLGLAERVIFAGPRTDAVDLMPQLDVSVLPSLTEGLSNTLIESMAAGVPTVATRVGGTPEVVVDGETGLLVPPSQPARMAAAIERLIESRDLAARFARAGRRRYEEHFTIDRMVQQTVRLYQRLLEPAGILQDLPPPIAIQRGARR
jgi:glycosyltransferase involved in cell wall biosynthesis